MIVFNQIQALTTWNIMKRAVPGWSSWPISTFITGMLARKKKKKKIWVIIDEIIDHYQDPWFWALSFFFFFCSCLFGLQMVAWFQEHISYQCFLSLSHWWRSCQDYMNPRAGGGITVSTPRNHCVVGMREKKKKGSRKHCLKRETDYNTACIIWSCYRRVFPCWWIKPWFCKYS